MHRFYAQGPAENGVVRLEEEDARHASRVLRMKPGDIAEVFLDERRYQAEILRMDAADVLLTLGEELPSTEARLRVTLFQGLPKADKMELVLQKAVELGAEAVVPVAMSRCVVQLDAKDGRKKQERWQKIAREACKQSGRCRQTAVSEPVSFAQLVKALPGFDAAIVPWEDARKHSLSAFRREHEDVRSLAVVIGPEGGIDPKEIDQLREAGCLPVTLGPRILRTETAGLCALSALFCLYGDME